MADSYNHHGSVLGYMFDAAFEGPGTHLPREGCAVFLEAIAASATNPEAYTRQAIYTIGHELGHVFNLEHHQSKGNFMTQSWVYEGTAPDPSTLSFIDEHVRRLATASPNHNEGWACRDGASFKTCTSMT